MRKILIIFSIIFLHSCNGYQPIFKTQEANFFIAKITNITQDQISNQIRTSLKPYTKNNNNQPLILELESKKNEKILSKDKKGNPVVFELKIETNVKIIFEDKSQKEFKFSKKFNYNNQSNKFELKQYKDNIEKNLTNEIFENLIFKLRSI